MRKIGDKIVYNTIEEILDPSHTYSIGSMGCATRIHKIDF
jgi:hypothetical protein